MTLTSWLIEYLVISLFSAWVGFGKGATQLANCRLLWLISPDMLGWSSEQIRLYVLTLWLANTLWLVGMAVFLP